MRKAAMLGCLVAGVLALLFFGPANGLARDAGLLALIACIGVYVTWTLPLQDE